MNISSNHTEEGGLGSKDYFSTSEGIRNAVQRQNMEGNAKGPKNQARGGFNCTKEGKGIGGLDFDMQKRMLSKCGRITEHFWLTKKLQSSSSLRAKKRGGKKEDNRLETTCRSRPQHYEMVGNRSDGDRGSRSASSQFDNSGTWRRQTERLFITSKRKRISKKRL